MVHKLGKPFVNGVPDGAKVGGRDGNEWEWSHLEGVVVLKNKVLWTHLHCGHISVL